MSYFNDSASQINFNFYNYASWVIYLNLNFTHLDEIGSNILKKKLFNFNFN